MTITIIENGKDKTFDNFKAAHMYFTGMVNAGRWGLEAIREVKERAQTEDVTITIEAYQVTEDGVTVDALTAGKINAAAEERRLASEAEMAAIHARHEAAAAAQRMATVEGAYAARVEVVDVLLAAGLIDGVKRAEMVDALRPAEVKEKEGGGDLSLA